MNVKQSANQLTANIERVILGKAEAIELAVVALFSGGHVLLQDVPGVGKTMLARAGDEDSVATIDADNTHPAGLLLNMLEEARAGADLVIASRYAPGGKEEGVPFRRRILSRGIGVLLRVRFGLREVRDYSSGYRLYRARLLRAVAERYGSRLIEAQGFAVMTDLLVKLQALSPRVVEVPLRLRYDLKRGSSKLRLRQTIADYLALLVRRP